MMIRLKEIAWVARELALLAVELTAWAGLAWLAGNGPGKEKIVGCRKTKQFDGSFANMADSNMSIDGLMAWKKALEEQIKNDKPISGSNR